MNAVSSREGFAAFLLRARAKGIADNGLYGAIENVPREQFLPDEYADAAWSGQMVPIACGEAIEGIDLQAKVLSSLEVSTGQRVLEIGTGSGYTAAVMAGMGAKVKTIDRYKTLISGAQERFVMLGIGNAIAHQADGLRSSGQEGPFDRIVAWAAFSELPRKYVDLLATGGLMIAPIGADDDEQRLARLTKIGSRFEREDIGVARLQPLLPGLASAL